MKRIAPNERFYEMVGPRAIAEAKRRAILRNPQNPVQEFPRVLEEYQRNRRQPALF